MRYCLMAFTDDPVLAGVLDDAGVDRIGVDIEMLGKAERQPGKNFRISGHSIDALPALGRVLKRAALLARLNSLHAGSAGEIETALAYGAKVLILPYFKSIDEPREAARLVAGRALLLPLIETPEALETIDGLAADGFPEVYFGLNDLRLRLGYADFAPVFGYPPFVRAVAAARGMGLRCAIAGVARPDDRSLPIAPELVYGQLRRLGATGTLISRSFLRPKEEWGKMADDIRALRAILEAPADRSP